MEPWQRRPIPINRRVEDWRPRDRPCGDCASRVIRRWRVGSRGCFTEHAALPIDRDPQGWLRRPKKRRAAAANDQHSNRMQSVGLWTDQDNQRTVAPVNGRHGKPTIRPRSDQITGMGLVKLRRSRKTGRSAAWHAVAGWTDRLRVLVRSSGRIVGPARVAAAW